MIFNLLEFSLIFMLNGILVKTIFFEFPNLSLFLGNGPETAYGFNDVLDSIRRNETTLEIARKFLSAAVALTARSDSNPKFMLWTVPTTLFALLGIVYFVGQSS